MQLRKRENIPKEEHRPTIVPFLPATLIYVASSPQYPLPSQSSLLLRSDSPIDLTAEQQTAPTLLPMRHERAQMQQHQRARALAVAADGRAAEGGLKKVRQL